MAEAASSPAVGQSCRSAQSQSLRGSSHARYVRASAAHHHAPPTGFIRKYVFSLDHKVIGEQYYALALVAVYIGLVLSWIMRIHLAWPNCSHSRSAVPVQDRRARRRDDARVLSATDDHARHHHGLLRAHYGSVCGLRQLLPAHPGRRGRHAVSAHQHDVVLGDLRRIPGRRGRLLRSPGTAALRLDGLRSAECARPGCRARARNRPGPVGRFHRYLLHGTVAWAR